MRGICKYFPGVRALENVDFTLHSGEVHALVGENGAGKSTLIKVLTGVHAKDGGKIAMEGRPISPSSPLEAMKCGISTVYQEVNLCPNLSVAENIFIGREPKKAGGIDWKTINRRAAELLTTLNLNIDVTKTLGSYSVAVQQMIAIARAVDVDAKVLILDEPTSSLDEEETQRLFAVVRKLKAQGLGVIFVSHFLDQIYELCDRITVLRNGELVGAYAVAELPRVELISKMIGKELGDIQSMGKNTALCGDEVLIEADGLSAFGRIQDFDLQIHRGEVVGFAGLLGSGRTETAELLAGVAKPEQGALRMNGREVHFNSPLDAMHHKIAFCPEDRKIQGIIGDLSVRENIIIGLQAKKGMWNHIPLKEQERIADEYIKLLQIKVSSPEQLIRNLSGGNQQKAIIARWLVTQPDLLILDEPTRGIDIGTKTEIQKMVIQLAREQHMSIIFISSEIDEMTRTCTRLAVLRDRRKVAELTGDDINSDRVMAAIAGGAFVIATGGIDISQGSVIAISGAICCSLIGGAGDGTANMPLLPACLIAVLVCALCGVWNGFLVSKLKIQPMVATLILLTAGRGIAMLITKGQNVTVYYEPFTYIGTTIPGSPLPTTIFIAALMVLFVVLIQKKTSVGLFVQAVGINANAARRTGLKVSSIIFMVYVFSGICAGIAGLMESSMIAAADPNNAGLNMEMDAILSVALGGTLLSGGKFYIGGSIIGAITIQTMTTTLYALGVSSEQLPVYKALVVILICLLQSEKFKGVLEKRTAEKAVKQR